MNFDIFPFNGGATAERKAFSCGNEDLDEWFRKRAGQDAKRHYASIFIACPEKQKNIIGFYSLSAASVRLERISEEDARGLPRYPDIPSLRLGRLAVDYRYQRRNIGSLLVMDALARACANTLAWALFIVDAKDEAAKKFYEKLCFKPFQDNPFALWMKRKQAEAFVP